jgi:hypothetical protein
VRNPALATCLLLASFLFNSLSDPEDSGDIFLQNNGELSLDYTPLFQKADNNMYYILPFRCVILQNYKTNK